MKAADLAGAGVAFGFGAFVTQQAWQLEYWRGDTPGPGFLPLWLGLLLMGCAAALFGSSLRPKASDRAPAPAPPPAAPERRSALVEPAVPIMFGLAAALAVAAPWLGMIPAICAFLLAATFYLEPRRRTRNVAVAVAVPVALWLLFVQWLRVPLPAGFLGF